MTTLARLFQSFLGHINGASSLRISREVTDGRFKFPDAVADGLAATFGEGVEGESDL